MIKKWVLQNALGNTDIICKCNNKLENKTGSKKLLSVSVIVFATVYLTTGSQKVEDWGPSANEEKKREDGKWDVLERSQVTGVIHKRLAECLFSVKQRGGDGNVASSLKMREVIEEGRC